jgi:hypothetical protein
MLSQAHRVEPDPSARERAAAMTSGNLTIPPETAKLLDHSAERLAARFTDHFSAETVRECLDDSYLVLAATHVCPTT